MNQTTNLERRVYHNAWRSWGKPNVTPEIHAAIADPLHRPFAARTLQSVPVRFRADLLDEYRSRADRQSPRNANVWLREAVEQAFGGSGLSLAVTDDEISQHAEGRAKFVKDILAKIPMATSEAVIEFLQRICDQHGVVMPTRKTLAGTVARMSDTRWWRRAINRQLMKKREAGAIMAGFVHCKKGLYVSDDAMHRHQQADKRSKEWMGRMELVNEETGEILDLSEAAKTNVSNPAIRRAEMMTRVKGEEQASNLLGYRALFITLTCPSRMHARDSKSGRPNPKYDGTTPEQSHKYLNRQFAKTRAAIHRDGIRLFGLRVVEPHHDGTPHWHMLVFVHPADRCNLLAIMRRYALEHDADEPGASKRRFTVKHIDPAKGSAVGYVAKYVSKNLDGEGVGLDFEADGENATSTASRVVVWAKTWRIRQFQFFGDSPVSIYRELRRLRNAAVVPEEFQPHWKAADSGNWQGYMKAMQEAPLKLWSEDIESQRYPGEFIAVVRGVELNGVQLETRKGRWTLREKANADPWTRVNNCTRADFDAGKTKPLSVFLPGKRHLVVPGECTSSPAQSKLSNKNLAGRVAA